MRMRTILNRERSSSRVYANHLQRFSWSSGVWGLSRGGACDTDASSRLNDPAAAPQRSTPDGCGGRASSPGSPTGMHQGQVVGLRHCVPASWATPRAEARLSRRACTAASSLLARREPPGHWKDWPSRMPAGGEPAQHAADCCRQGVRAIWARSPRHPLSSRAVTTAFARVAPSTHTDDLEFEARPQGCLPPKAPLIAEDS